MISPWYRTHWNNENTSVPNRLAPQSLSTSNIFMCFREMQASEVISILPFPCNDNNSGQFCYCDNDATSVKLSMLISCFYKLHFFVFTISSWGDANLLRYRFPTHRVTVAEDPFSLQGASLLPAMLWLPHCSTEVRYKHIHHHLAA